MYFVVAPDRQCNALNPVLLYEPKEKGTDGRKHALLEAIPAVSRGEKNMYSKQRRLLFFCAAGLLLLAPAHGFAALRQAQSEKQAEQTKSVSGKVASIGSDKKSITLEVDDGSDKHTMEFIVNQNTQVTARVSTGSMATVQYQPTSDNQYLALVISPQDTQ